MTSKLNLLAILFALISLTLSQSVKTVYSEESKKLLLINDVHLNLESDQPYSEPGHEATPQLLKNVLKEAADLEAKSSEPIAAILLIGDLVKHGVAVPIDSTTTNEKLMLETMRQVFQEIMTAFPDIPIIPVVGNNDVVYHDQAPTAENKEAYYTAIWEIWFENVPANAHIAANDTIKATWMQGGYYVYELSEDIMILSLNGMYPFYENFADKEVATQMLQWVNSTLAANRDKKFITQTHVFFGNNWYHDLEVLWNKTYTDQMVSILYEHQERLIVALGAHIHHVQLMAPESATVPGLEIVQIISPAVSPIYYNNPGYGQLIISAKNHIESLTFNFFQLEDYERLGIAGFVQYDPAKYLDVDLNDALAVRELVKGLKFNFQKYAGYTARSMGLRDMLAQGSQFLWPFFSQVYTDQADQVATVCSLMYFDVSLFPDYCLEAIKTKAEPTSKMLHKHLL